MRGGVSVVQGEVSQLLSAMRKAGRWSGHVRTEGEQDPLVQGLYKLKDTLNSTSDLLNLDVTVFLRPFCEIVQSDDTTGPITGMAIASLDKFLAYGLINPAHPSAASGIESLSEAVTHARFVGTNPASDEVVLMKILQVLHTLMLTPVGRLLSNESVCEIMQSCFRICFEMRLSELLRNYAESTLVDMVQLLFSRLHSFSEDEHTVDDTASMDQTLSAAGEKEREPLEPVAEEGEEGGEEEEEEEEEESRDHSEEVELEKEDQSEQQEESHDPDGPPSDKPEEPSSGFVSSDVCYVTSRHKHVTVVPYGLPCVRELLRFLVSITNMRERHNSESLLHIGLNLVTVALECGGRSLCKFPSLAQLVQDGLSRNLFTLLRHSSFSLFTAALRAMCLLMQQCRYNLRLQVEWQLNTLMDILTTDSSKIPYERKEVALETIVQLSHVPHLMVELYVNYDCSLYCSNVFENLTKLLSKNAFPTQGLFSTHLLSLDALLAIVHNFQMEHTDLTLIPRQQIPWQQSPRQPKKHLQVPNEHQQLTQFNSAGIIFTSSSGQEEEEEVTSQNNIPTVQSELTLPVVHSSENMLRSQSANNSSGDDVIRSASGYLRGVGGEGEGEGWGGEEEEVALPTAKELIEVRQRKKLILAATEQFNKKPKQGILFLQERGIIPPSSSEQFPQEVANFLVDNPRLNKAMIGEYIGDRRNTSILEEFVKRFSLHGSHLVDALRHFLESFRLPGESPVIARILETFSEHWLSCNHDAQGKIFANRDAVYVLCYAILMLNTDQHSSQVKKRMTLEEFIHNQRKINNGEDFPHAFLTDIFNRIREEEIIMPDEHGGVVRENYLWKVLLHRSTTSEGVFLPVTTSSFNQDLFLLSWGPTIAALSYVFDNAEEKHIVQKAISGFSTCASVAAHYELKEVFDNLIISLCKFSTLLNTPESPSAVFMTLGSNTKVRQSLHTMFSLAHHHGDILREGWKNILDCLLTLFKAKLLPEELVQVGDFLHASGSVSLFREEAPSTRHDSSLLSSLYNYWLLSDGQSGSSKTLTPSEIKARKAAMKCVKECHPEQLFSESKFLRPDSLLELVKTLTFASRGPEDHLSLGTAFHEETAVFFLELLVTVAMENKDRIGLFWGDLNNHMSRIILTAQKQSYLLERCVVGLLRLAIRLMSRETMATQLLNSLRVLLILPPPSSHPHLLTTHNQIANGISELIQSQANSIKLPHDWSVLFSTLECIGAGMTQTPAISAVPMGTGVAIEMEHSEAAEEGEVPDGQAAEGTSQSDARTSPDIGTGSSIKEYVWISGEERAQKPVLSSLNQFDLLVEETIQPHDSHIFFKCCETLSYLVRSDLHVTALNFSSCVHCIRTFSEVSSCQLALEQEASAGRVYPSHHSGGSLRQHGRPVSPSWSPSQSAADGKDSQTYTTSSLQLLDLMDTLFSRVGRIFTEETVARLQREARPEEGDTSHPRPSTSCGLLWHMTWCPLLQGMARMCCDSRKSVRQTAITYLQRALLAHELQNLTSWEWEACFLEVFFPMLSRLLEAIPTPDQLNLEETRVRASNLLCKVFLQHLLSLSSLPHFSDLWLGILDFMDKFLHLDNSDLLSEAIPESLKNMLLVMSTQGVLDVSINNSQSDTTIAPNKNDTSRRLLDMTWLRIEQFLPNFLKQLFPTLTPPQSTPSQPSHPPPPSHSPAPSQQQSPQETVVIQEVQVTMATEQTTGGITMATTPLPASRSPSRSPEISPHASPPTSNSPVAELQAAGEVPIGAFPITLHPPLPTVTLSTSQPQETSQTGVGQGPILVQPAPQDSQVSPSVFNV